jgi:hypothetical protein
MLACHGALSPARICARSLRRGNQKRSPADVSSKFLMSWWIEKFCRFPMNGLSFLLDHWLSPHTQRGRLKFGLKTNRSGTKQVPTSARWQRRHKGAVYPCREMRLQSLKMTKFVDITVRQSPSKPIAEHPRFYYPVRLIGKPTAPLFKTFASKLLVAQPIAILSFG